MKKGLSEKELEGNLALTEIFNLKVVSSIYFPYSERTSFQKPYLNLIIYLPKVWSNFSDFKRVPLINATDRKSVV